MSLQDSRSNLASARQQLNQSKQVVAQSKTELQTYQQQVQENLSKIPKPTARDLRINQPGLRGLQQRRRIEEVKKKLSKEGEIVSSNLQKLNKYESDVLNPYEKQIVESERQIKAYEDDVSKLNYVRKMISYGKELQLLQSSDLRIRELAREYIKEGASVTEKRLDEIEKIQNQLPEGEQLRYDPKTLEIQGVDSKSLGEFIPVENGVLTYGQLPGKPTGSITQAPTTLEKYKSSINQGGYVKGTLNFFKTQAQEKFTRLQDFAWKMGDKGAYSQTEPTQNLIGLGTSIAPYTVPVLGSGLLVAGGVEDYGNLYIKGNESRIAESSQDLKEKGYGNVISKAPYVLPAVEIGVGYFGLKGELGNIKANREANLLENAPSKVSGYRVTGNEGGFEILTSVKKTKPSWFDRNIFRIQPTTQTTKVFSPFRYVDDTKVLVEGGKGLTTTKSGGKIVNSLFDFSGNVKAVKQNLKIQKGSVSKITDFGSGGGSVYLRERLVSEGVIVKNYNSLKNTVTYSYKGKILKSDKEAKALFIGGSKTEGDITQIISGTPSKVKINTNTGQTSVKAEASQYGYIRNLEYKGNNVYFHSNTGASVPTSQKSALQSNRGEGLVSFNVLKTSESKSFTSSSSSPLASSKELGVFPVVSAQAQEIKPQTKETGIIKAELDIKQSEKDRSQVKDFQLMKPEFDESNKADFRSIESLKPEINQSAVPKVISLLKQVLKTKQKPSQPTTITLNPRLITPPRTPKKPVPVSFPDIKSSGNSGKSRKIQNMFEAFARRKGKDFSLGKFGSQNQAESVLKRFLKKTLARSGKIKKGGQELDFEDLGILKGFEFRPSKKSSKRIVQKAKYSLSSPSEKSEIQYFKKISKSKKSKSLFGL